MLIITAAAESAITIPKENPSGITTRDAVPFVP
jgi:hypothetical protein